MSKPAKMRLLPKYIENIRKGKKTTTIRKGKRKIITPELVFESFTDSILVQILSVRYPEFCDLTDEDAQKDGFADLEELKTVLYNFYPHIKPNSVVTIIEFKV